jgi:PAS domain S-box-containing protein
MSLISKISIKRKVILIILLTNFVLVLIGFSLEVYYATKTMKTNYIENISLHTRNIGQQCAVALDFEYEEDAQRALNSFQTIPSIKKAFLFNTNKKLIAQYTSDKLGYRIKTDFDEIKNKPFFHNDTLFVKESIFLKDEYIGDIVVVADTKISQKVNERYLILGSASIILLVIALFLATYLQKFITNPIIDLAEKVTTISEKNDFSIRIKNLHKDEIGILIARINNFLEVIQKRELERDVAELALRESEERFRSLAELLPEMVFEVDSFLNFTFINDSAKFSLGYDNEEVKILNFKQVLAQSENHKLRNLVGQLIKTQSKAQIEVIACRKDGQEFNALVYASPLYKKDLQKGFRGILIDISELKKAQKEIEDLNKSLEIRVKERTKKLSKVNKELAEVSYVSAHDLKTPIRGITQLATWILQDNKEQLEPSVVHNLELLINRANHMNRLVNGILEYISIGKNSSNFTHFSFNEIIHFIKERKFNLPNVQIHIQGGETQLFFVRSHFVQIFTELIENAIKFNANEKKEIYLCAKKNSEFIKFSVKDNGFGIEPKYQKKVFGVFKTLSSDYDNQNIGIGLALVKKIVEIYNGKIKIHSLGNNQGTKIFFNLKLIKSDNEQQ